MCMIEKINNVLSEKEINNFITMTKTIEPPFDNDRKLIHNEENEYSVSRHLGRLQYTIKNIDHSLEIKLTKITNSFLNTNYTLSGTTYVEYSSSFGVPNLPPHFDGDETDLMINYQFLSNTSWPIGIDKNTYIVEDNSAIVFNPNKSIHWRPKKIFKDDEFVKMIFFRFVDLKNKKDNSHLRYSLDHEILKDVNDFRNNLT